MVSTTLVCLGPQIAYQQDGHLPLIFPRGSVLEVIPLHAHLLTVLRRSLRLPQFVVLGTVK